MSYTYKYPRPAVTVDIALLLKKSNQTLVLLIQRKNEPFKNYWATPGGFVDENEDPLLAAERELHEETNIKGVHIEPIGFSGTPKHKANEHVVSLWYMGVVTKVDVANAKAQDDAKNLEWFDINNLPNLAFDHKNLLDLVRYNITK